MGKVGRVLEAMFGLLLCQLAGEAVRTVAHVPVPGPVLGMVILAGWYGVRRREPGEGMQQTADALLGWLGLLFVPAGVGIVANMALLRTAWLPISVGLVGSTVLTLLVTAAVMRRARA